MIVVELIGGLGNQLFQYCIARHLAEIHQTELILDLCAFDKYKLHKFSLQHFNLKAKIINSINDPLPDNLNQITEKSLNYNQKILKSPNNSRLQGYFQSSLYFQNISRIIRNDIVLKLQQKGKDLKTAEEINNTNSVSIHVRRSDYISDKATNDIHGSCDISYYLKTINHISKQIDTPHFFVFSDDHQWVIDNLKSDQNMTYVDHNEADTNYEDLRLMSQCDHNIIANSSFSWWGAWLNDNSDKIVIAPRYWFQRIDMNNKIDIIPNDWIRI